MDEQQEMIDAILKVLIDERDLRELPYDRLKALATRIADRLSGASLEKVFGREGAAHVRRSRELEEQGDAAADAGEHGRALALYLASADETLAIEWGGGPWKSLSPTKS